MTETDYSLRAARVFQLRRVQKAPIATCASGAVLRQLRWRSDLDASRHAPISEFLFEVRASCRRAGRSGALPETERRAHTHAHASARA
eukprot:1089703-Pleurochrysis_carterae.AAC.3